MVGPSGTRSVPVALTTTTTEVLETQARLWCHTYGYLKSMALHSAIKLGVPNAMSRRRGAASLTELHADLPIARSKRPCLSRLMRFLAAIGIFSEAEQDTAATAATGDQRRYRLTAASRLLVHDDGGDTRLSPFLTVCVPPSYFAASLRLPEWLEAEDQAATPFKMLHGIDIWSAVDRDAEFTAAFKAGMGADSRFVARIAVGECGEVFAGVESLVDVGGGDGTMATGIAAAFPNIQCSVLELPRIVDGAISATAAGGGGSGSSVEFVAGDNGT
jgi:trans-resveratrol di-O-methyltransferase